MIGNGESYFSEQRRNVVTLTSPDSGVLSRSLRVWLDPKLNQIFCSTIQIVRISAINTDVFAPIRHSSDDVGRSTVRNHEKSKLVLGKCSFEIIPLLILELFKDCKEFLGRLSSIQLKLVVDGKEWHPTATPSSTKFTLLASDFIPSDKFNLQQSFYHIHGHTRKLGTFSQYLRLSQALFLFKVGREECLHHSVLQFASSYLSCHPNQPMTIKSVSDQSTITEIDSYTCAYLFHLRHHLLYAVRTESFIVVLHLVEALPFGQSFIQLKGPPANIKLMVRRALGKRCFEPSFTHKAPGSDGIGNNVNRNDTRGR